MEVIVEYDDDIPKYFTYWSQYNRINAKGIKEEARTMLSRLVGYDKRNCEIISIRRN